MKGSQGPVGKLLHRETAAPPIPSSAPGGAQTSAGSKLCSSLQEPGLCLVLLGSMSGLQNCAVLAGSLSEKRDLISGDFPGKLGTIQFAFTGLFSFFRKIYEEPASK